MKNVNLKDTMGKWVLVMGIGAEAWGGCEGMRKNGRLGKGLGGEV